MAIDDVTEQQSVPTQPAGDAGRGIKFIMIFVVLAVLAVGEIYTISRLSSLRDELLTQQNELRKDLTAQVQDQVSARLTAVEQQTAQQLEGVKTELDKAAKRMGSQGGELHQAHEMVTELQDQQRKQAEELKQELAQKADQKQLGALTQDVSTNKTDIDTTKKAVTSLAADLGMARSELGTLIARNHDDIEYLRKLGERDYFEFTLDKTHPGRVAGVGLALRKTNAKRYRYNLAMTVDDVEVEKKDCTQNEPVFFYVNGSKKPYEIVVNKVESNQVKGYLSTPKGVTEVAARSEGTH
jgi:vacuolar-type H+-ATPase subunit I/STV1